MAITVWLLPDPDSPTMPSVRPASSENDTRCTASTGAPSRRVKRTLRSLTSSSGMSAVLRIECGAQTVADEIHAVERHAQHHSRAEQQPRHRFELLRAVLNQHAPARHGFL